jgi:hypothetical protein
MMGEVSMGRQYYEIARLFNSIPMVAAVFGHIAQAQAFPVAMCHGLVMIKDASLSLSHPDAVKAMLGEKNDYQSLGGANLHSCQTGRKRLICGSLPPHRTGNYAMNTGLPAPRPSGSIAEPRWYRSHNIIQLKTSDIIYQNFSD